MSFICRYCTWQEIPLREPAWYTTERVWDLAISADGSIVAAATYDEGLKVYDSNGILLWSWSATNITVTAVDVSDNGNVVAAAIHNVTSKQDLLLFWKNAKMLSGTPAYNWSSIDLGGWIGVEALALSSDGNQVVVVGTGEHIYYWNNALTLSGSYLDKTWGDYVAWYLECVSISDDGDTISILETTNPNGYGNVSAFVYKNCKSRTGWQSQGFDLSCAFGYWSLGPSMAMSDDGFYVVVCVSNNTGNGKICFFNMSTFEPWSPQWTFEVAAPEWIAAVDISSDGDTVVAVTNSLKASPYMLAIFHDAQSKTGNVADPDDYFNGAHAYTGYNYVDVEVDGAGNVAVGGTGDYVFAVNASTGYPLWLYNGTWPYVSWFVKFSDDGNAIATAGPGPDSLYYFRLAEAAPPVGGFIVSSSIITSLYLVILCFALALVTAGVLLKKRVP